ncbi:MAG: AAA family ATPase [Treponema sp.]|nr:AAA family ATPase [Spirochaetia bacterium]MDD7458684.1 AAA family ATPase [Spirochaetales bacterium]MDY5812117.1 AAA family ATPase [Treponema sp.]MEE1180700.1 AAA family ATPase [Treponema sp.]
MQIDRICTEHIRQKLFKGKAVVVYGPRQCGKTTLIKNLLKTENLDAVFLNGDDDSDISLFASSGKTFAGPGIPVRQ